MCVRAYVRVCVCVEFEAAIRRRRRESQTLFPVVPSNFNKSFGWRAACLTSLSPSCAARIASSDNPCQIGAGVGRKYNSRRTDTVVRASTTTRLLQCA